MGSMMACTFQFAASLAVTLIVALGEVAVHGVGSAEQDVIRGQWEGKPLVYKEYTLLWVLVAFCWVEVIFVVWR
jgi:hypothetical protein